MKVALLLAAVALSVTPVQAADREPTRRETNKTFHKGMVGVTRICADFGFKSQKASTLDDVQFEQQMLPKIEAERLLRGVDDNDTWLIMYYTHIVGPVMALAKPKETPEIQKAGDAIAAAVNDPSRMDEARGIYVDAVMQLFNAALKGCEAGAADAFVGKHYLTGVGSTAGFERDATEEFAAAVKEVSKQP